MHKSSSQTALKVISIIVTVLASLSLLALLFLLLSLGILIPQVLPGHISFIFSILFLFLGIVALASGAFMLVVGIFGIRAANNPGTIGTYFVLSLVNLSFAATSTLSSVLGSAQDFWIILGSLISLALPVALCLLTVTVMKENQFCQPLP